MPIHFPPGEGAVDALVQLANSTPLGVRGIAAVAGGLLLVAGARLYRLAIVAPGILGGLVFGAAVPVSNDPMTQGIYMVIVGVVGAIACHFLERVAIHAIGAVVTAGVVNAAWPLVTSQVTPWWAPVAAALLGSLLFPTLFKALLKGITALLGAITLAWAAGWSDRLWIMAALAAVGLAIQVGAGRKKTEAQEEE